MIVIRFNFTIIIEMSFSEQLADLLNQKSNLIDNIRGKNNCPVSYCRELVEKIIGSIYTYVNAKVDIKNFSNDSKNIESLGKTKIKISDFKFIDPSIFEIETSEFKIEKWRDCILIKKLKLRIEFYNKVIIVEKDDVRFKNKKCGINRNCNENILFSTNKVDDPIKLSNVCLELVDYLSKIYLSKN